MSEFTCKGCGVCCIAIMENKAWANLTLSDLGRLSRTEQAHVVYVPRLAIRTRWRRNITGPFTGLATCNCAFLRGSIMQSASCRIYERRPAVCRNVITPGDPTCLAARKLFLDNCPKERT